jgi:glycosyltransferase involved in cell wall biosynthesis
MSEREAFVEPGLAPGAEVDGRRRPAAGSVRPRVHIIGPSVEAPGGVASYYGVLLPRLQRNTALEVGQTAIGSARPDRPPWYILSDQWRVYRALKRLRPAIVHVNPSLGPKSFYRDALFVRAAKAQGAKVLVFFHGWSRDFERAVDGPLSRVFAATYGKADAFIVLAQDFAEALRRWGVRGDIHLGTTVVDEEQLDAEAVHARLNGLTRSRPLKVLFMARLEPEKGALETVQAVVRLAEAGAALELRVAGSGPAEPAIRRYLEKHPEAGRCVSLLGHVSGAAKTALLLSHDVFCLPTRYGEGMPTSVLEAMAFGMGVVTSPVGGLKDFFQPPQMGALVAADDVGQIMQAVQALDADRPGLAAVGRFNFDYARTRFYSARVAEQIESIYAQLLGGDHR